MPSLPPKVPYFDAIPSDTRMFFKERKRALHEMVQTANKLRSAAVLCVDEPQSFNLESMH